MNKVVLLIIWMALVATTNAQQQSTQKPSSYIGRHFLLSFMENEITAGEKSSLMFVLSVSCVDSANVVVMYPGGKQILYMKPNSMEEIQIPRTLEVAESEQILNYVVEVTSDALINLVGYSTFKTSTDCFSVLPVHHWGKEYSVFSAPNDNYMADISVSSLRQSEFIIIGSEANTKVAMLYKSKTEKGKAANAWDTVTIQKGQCFLVKSERVSAGLGDLTGTWIVADKPIGVISGHSRTSIPQNLEFNRDSKDHLCEWMIPVSSWGTEYFTVPSVLPPGAALVGDLFRVISGEDDTRITIITEADSLSYYLAKKGDYATVTTSMAYAARWYSDKKFSVAQYMKTGYVAGSDKFDPYLSIIAPSNKMVQRSTFQTPGSVLIDRNQFNYHWVNLVCDVEALPTLRIDGEVVGLKNPEIYTQKFLNSNKHFVKFPLKPGPHEIECNEGFFSGLIYGTGLADSYGSNLGFSMYPPMQSDTLPPIVVATENCGIVNVRSNDAPSVNSGIAYIRKIDSRSFNYSFTSRFNRDSAFGVGSPIDKSKSAFLELEVLDNAGNKSTSQFSYTPPRFTVTDTVFLKASNQNSTVCGNVVVGNRDLQFDLQLDSILVYSNGTLSNNTNTIFPTKVVKNSTRTWEFCFSPKGATGRVIDSAIFSFTCGISRKVVFVADIPKGDLSADDIDFKEVLVGDTVCRKSVVRNNGDIPIVVTKLDCTSCLDVFFAQGLSLPFTLQPRDSIEVLYCFRPTSRSEFGDSIVVFSNIGIQSFFRLRGVGVAPNVLITNCYWNEVKRIGIRSDSIFVVKNIGNSDATVRLDSTIGTLESFILDPKLKAELRISPGDSVVLNSSFLPRITGNSKITNYFSCQWKLHPSLKNELEGSSELPTLITYDYVFPDTLIVGNKDTRNIKLFEIIGGGVTTVDSVVFSSSNFSMQPFSKGVEYLSGNSESRAITFSPNRIGAFVDTLLIYHDADTAYRRKLSKVLIKGFARDSLKEFVLSKTVEFSCSNLVNGNACEGQMVDFTIRNIGDTEVMIDSVCLGYSGKTIIKIISQPIKRNELFGGMFLLPSLSGGLYNFTVSVYSADTTITKQLIYDVQQNILTTAIGVPMNVEVGKVFSASFDISKQNPSVNSVIPNLSFSVTPQNFVLVDSLCLIRFYTKQSNSAYTKEFWTRVTPQRDGGYNVDFRNEVDSSIVMVDIDSVRLLPVLSEVSFVNVRISTSADSCFEQSESAKMVEVQNVCVNDLRFISDNSNFFKVLSNSGYTDNTELLVPYESNNDFNVEIELIELSGKIFSLNNNFMLRKGNHSLKLDVSSMSSGFYIVSIRSDFTQKQLPIIIYK